MWPTVMAVRRGRYRGNNNPLSEETRRTIERRLRYVSPPRTERERVGTKHNIIVVYRNVFACAFPCTPPRPPARSVPPADDNIPHLRTLRLARQPAQGKSVHTRTHRYAEHDRSDSPFFFPAESTLRRGVSLLCCCSTALPPTPPVGF